MSYAGLSRSHELSRCHDQAHLEDACLPVSIVCVAQQKAKAESTPNHRARREHEVPNKKKIATLYFLYNNTHRAQLAGEPSQSPVPTERTAHKHAGREGMSDGLPCLLPSIQIFKYTL